jgi:hypothetical protein
MPGGSVTKIGCTYKKIDIHSKETKHTSHDKTARTSHEETAYLTKFHSTVKCNEQNRRYKTQNNKQNTEKQQNTQKQQNTKTRKKLLPGIEPGPSSL